MSAEDAENNLYHDGASRARRLGNWGTRTAGATDEVIRELAILRDRSRSLRRNNPWINRAVSISTSMHIGNGVRPRPCTDDKEFNSQLLELWRFWSDYADYNNHNGNIYSVQEEMVRAKYEAGESFGLIHKTRANEDTPLGLKIQVLESDQCPLYMNKVLQNGNEIKSGIELTSTGRITAYWFYKRHPNLEQIMNGDYEDTVRIKAANVIHYFKADRPSQLRGRPLVTSSIVKAKTYDQYTDSELVRKDSRAKFTGTIEREAYSEADYKYNPIDGSPLPNTEDEIPDMVLEAGSFPALLAGEKLNLFDGDQDSNGFGEFQEWQILAISSGMGIPYQLVSGDWKTINDRVWRAIFNIYKRQIEQEQDVSIVSRILKPIWKAFVDRAIVTGAIAPPRDLQKWMLYKAKFKFQTFEYLNILQDVQSDILKVSAGFESRESVIERTGKDVTIEEVDQQRADISIRELELGIRPYEEMLYPEPIEPVESTEPTKKDGDTE